MHSSETMKVPKNSAKEIYVSMWINQLLLNQKTKWFVTWIHYIKVV